MGLCGDLTPLVINALQRKNIFVSNKVRMVPVSRDGSIKNLSIGNPIKGTDRSVATAVVQFKRKIFKNVRSVKMKQLTSPSQKDVRSIL